MTQTIPLHIPPALVRDYDYFDLNGENDVFEHFRKLHSGPDFFYTPRNGGHWVATRYEDLDFILTNPEHFSSRHQLVPPPPDAGLGLVNYDGAKHASFRGLVQPFFTPKAIAALEGDVVKVTNDLIDSFIERGECEFMEEFAVKMPVVITMKTIIDLPHEDAKHLVPLVDAVARSGNNPEAFAGAFGGLWTYFAEKIVPARRANPGHDVISAVVHGKVEGGRPLTDQEILGVCTVIILGGLDTVTCTLGFFAKYLAEQPEQRQKLIDNPALINDATEELLRRYAIINVGRVVKQDIDYKGVPFRVGDMVLTPTTAGAIDEHHYPSALTVDFARQDKRHLTFIRGPHNCLGAHVARMELRIFLREWLKRLPDFEIRPGAVIKMGTGVANRIMDLPLVWKQPTHR